MQAPEGVASLAVNLLARAGCMAELRELLEGPHQALLQPLEPVLREQGCLDALGLLQAASGLSSEALDTWRVRQGVIVVPGETPE